MNFKLPSWKTTFRFYKRLGDLLTFGKIAQISGVEVQTSEAWARPVESDEFPNGSGKRNTMDCMLRQIRHAHTKDRGLARDMAQTFPEYVDFLDENAGIERARTQDTPLCQLIGKSAKEHLDIVLAYMDSSEPDYERIETEINEHLSIVNEMLSCVREKRKEEVEQFVFETPTNGNGAAAKVR